jgi:hypothetical protein
MSLEDFQNYLKDEQQFETAMKLLFFAIFGIAAAVWCSGLVGGWVPVWPRIAITGAFILGGWLGSLLWKLWVVLMGLGVIAALGWWIYQIFAR